MRYLPLAVLCAIPLVAIVFNRRPTLGTTIWVATFMMAFIASAP